MIVAAEPVPLAVAIAEYEAQETWAEIKSKLVVQSGEFSPDYCTPDTRSKVI